MVGQASTTSIELALTNAFFVAPSIDAEETSGSVVCANAPDPRVP